MSSALPQASTTQERVAVLIAQAGHPPGADGIMLYGALDMLVKSRRLGTLILRDKASVPDQDGSIWCAIHKVMPVYCLRKQPMEQEDVDARQVARIMELKPSGAVMWFDRQDMERNTLILVHELTRAGIILWWPPFKELNREFQEASAWHQHRKAAQEKYDWVQSAPKQTSVKKKPRHPEGQRGFLTK